MSTITSKILGVATTPKTIKQIATTLEAKHDNIRILVARLERRGYIKRVGTDGNHPFPGTQPNLWITTDEAESIAIRQAQGETPASVAWVCRKPATHRANRIQPSRTSFKVKQANMTIVGYLNDASEAAFRIMDTMRKGTGSKTYYVWSEGTSVMMCSDTSKVIFPESKLIGTYVWRKANRVTMEQVQEDIEAAYEAVFKKVA